MMEGQPATVWQEGPDGIRPRDYPRVTKTKEGCLYCVDSDGTVTYYSPLGWNHVEYHEPIREPREQAERAVGKP